MLRMTQLCRCPASRSPPFPCFALLFRAASPIPAARSHRSALLCLRVTRPHPSKPSLCRAIRCLALPLLCRSMRDLASPLRCRRSSSMPCHRSSLRCCAARLNAVAVQYYAFALLRSALPRLSFWESASSRRRTGPCRSCGIWTFEAPCVLPCGI